LRAVDFGPNCEKRVEREHIIFLLFSDGILRFGSVCVSVCACVCVCDVFAGRVDIVVWNKKKFSRYDAARDSRRASVYTHAHRTTLNVEQTAVMVQFDFLIIIRLLSLTSPFRFDNSWKRLSIVYHSRCVGTPPPPTITHELTAVTFYV